MNCSKCDTEMEGANCSKCGSSMSCNGDCKCEACNVSIKKEEASCDTCLAKTKEEGGAKE